MFEPTKDGFHFGFRLATTDPIVQIDPKRESAVLEHAKPDDISVPVPRAGFTNTPALPARHANSCPNT
jgi:hypothetical protein